MIQRILMLALVLLAFTMPTEAITYQELKTSPQFKLVHTRLMNGSMESGGLYIYLNTYSIEALRYAPPQYSLRGTYYVVMDTSYQSTIDERQLT
ncbi:MAG: hypothetical protein E6486_08410, partial [Streptococcus vestibularis]|nr:hypothetical protein [Streptococcus vestibularis]